MAKRGASRRRAGGTARTAISGCVAHAQFSSDLRSRTSDASPKLYQVARAADDDARGELVELPRPGQACSERMIKPDAAGLEPQDIADYHVA